MRAPQNGMGTAKTMPAASGQSDLLKGFGHAKDDPTFDHYLEEIRKFRKEMEELACTEAEADSTSPARLPPDV